MGSSGELPSVKVDAAGRRAATTKVRDDRYARSRDTSTYYDSGPTSTRLTFASNHCNLL